MDIIELVKAAVFGIVEGITEWLPISSTGHMLLLNQFLTMNVSEDFWNMFLVVIQLGAILAVCVIFFHRLNPFSPSKDRGEKRDTWLLWAKTVVACLPAAVMGRSLWELLTVYFAQAGQYNLLAMFLPNLYTWLGDSTAAEISRAGVMLAGGVVLCAVFFLWRLDFELTLDRLVSLGLFFALLTPFLLPHMHERYYFLADLLSVVFAFRFPKKWGIAFTVCVSSAYAVCHNLFGTDFFPVELLGVILLGVICFVVRHLAAILPRREAAA